MGKISTGRWTRIGPPADWSLSGPGSRTAYAMGECPKHGKTAHLSYLGGRCCVCQDELLREKDS